MPANSTSPAGADSANRCLQMGEHLKEARELLCLANRRGVRIPDDVLAPVIEADRRCASEEGIGLDLETRFWKAYGILRSSIEPATRARRLYRCVFYVSLALMLLGQLYFSFGSAVQRNTELPVEASAGAAAQLAPQTVDARREAYTQLASWLVWSPTEDPAVMLATLVIMLDFLGSYVLPALYGLLGACAFVLRQLSADISELRFANDLRVRYTLRLNIGLLAGLAVGWFITPDQNGSVVANLSPLALAFVAGYGSDLLFAVLDRIVNAFSGPQSPDAVADRPRVVQEASATAAAQATPAPPPARPRGRRVATNGAVPAPAH